METKPEISIDQNILSIVLEQPQSYKYNVCNYAGSILLKGEFEHTTTIDLRNFSKGFYEIVLVSGDQISRHAISLS